METAAELGLPLPGTSLVNQLFRAVEARGRGELGTQSLIQALERLAGIQVGGAPTDSADRAASKAADKAAHER